MKQLRTMLVVLSILAMSLTLFAACAPSAEKTEATTTSMPEEEATTAEAAGSDAAETTESAAESKADAASPEAEKAAPSGTMKVIATSESYQRLFDAFGKETGVKTELLSMSSGEVLAKVKAEGGVPAADLWFGGGIDSFISAKNDGLLEAVQFDAAKDLDPAYKDADNYWFSKGLTIVGFLLNNEMMTELQLDAPKTWDDLCKEAYKGEIVMSNPAISGTNYAAVNALLQNKGDQGWDYFEKLNANVAYYGRRGSDPSNKVSAGEFAIGITYLDGTIDQLAEEKDLTVVYPSDGIPYTPDGLAVFKNAENAEAAKAFVEWLFSNDENLRLLAEIDQKNSVKVIKPNLEGLDLGYDQSVLMQEDLSLFGSQREEILGKFETLMGDKAEKAK